jgi:Flp pilus assembly protein TadG
MTMRRLFELARAFTADTRGAVALNAGLALMPVMITLSFALDRAQV